jgi:hypothetical protein
MIAERPETRAASAVEGLRAALPAVAPREEQPPLTRRESALWALAEWRWPIIFALVLALIVEIPYRLAASQWQAGAYFVGMFWAPHDAAQYFSAMRQGAAGPAWTIYDHFTQEQHGPALMYTFYVGAGKLAGLLGISFDEMFLLTSTAGRIFLALAVYAFAGIATRDVYLRRLALVVISLSTGLATVLALVQIATGIPLPLNFRELNDPELNTFLTYFTAPHLMFSVGLLLISARLYAQTWETPRWRTRICLLLAVAGLGLTNPFPLLPLCVIVCLHTAAMTVWKRRINVGGVVGALTVMVGAAPFLLLSLVTFTLDPFWSLTYGRQNVTLTPDTQDLVLALGLVALLALFGLRGFLRPLTPGRLLVVLWIVAAILLMQAPTGIQRRFGIGLHPMLALVASFAVYDLRRALLCLRSPLFVLRPLTTVAVGQALFGSSAYMYVVALTIALAPSMAWKPYPDAAGADRSSYQQADVHAAADWLAATAQPDDVVLASALTGNYLAGILPGRSYVGHWVATLDYGAKKSRAEWFFAQPLDDERRAFLADAGIDYVVLGPAERLIGAESLNDPALTPVFTSRDALVYWVTP